MLHQDRTFFEKHTVEKQGRLIVNGTITVIDLYGDWYEMGTQYGLLAKPYLEDVLDFIDRRVVDEAGSREISDRLFANYPDYLKDFFEAAAKSSGISLERLKLCNAFEYMEECFFCSAMAVWDAYSDQGLVFGRNYDAASYDGMDKDIIVTVYHPDDGLAVATIGYAGEIYCVNGFNERGIFIELNNGMPSAGRDIHWEMCPATSELFDLLFKAETIDDVDEFFNSTRSFGSFLIGVADSREARLYEWCYEGVKRSDGQTPEGLMVGTNHYIHPDWKFAAPADADSWDSLTRRANMLECANEYKGRNSVETMKAIMSKPVRDGGPRNDFTRYQMVVVPADMTIHLKLSGSAAWSRLDLSSYLTSEH